MCGRTVVARSIGELVTLFDVDDVIGEQPGITYNNPPSLPASIIVDRVLKDNEGEHAGELRRQIHSARWGLVPKNSQGPQNTPMHNNARIETVLQKPTFRNAVLRQHCVMPVSGYYEWQIKEDGSKQPFYINAGDQGMLALAGIYDWWLDPSKKQDDPSRWLLSFAILTKDAAEPLAPIHERNPILLSSSSMAEWLDPDNLEDAKHATQDLLNELASESDDIAGQVEFWPVGTDVGNVRNSRENLISNLAKLEEQACLQWVLPVSNQMPIGTIKNLNSAVRKLLQKSNFGFTHSYPSRFCGSRLNYTGILRQTMLALRIIP